MRARDLANRLVFLGGFGEYGPAIGARPLPCVSRVQAGRTMQRDWREFKKLATFIITTDSALPRPAKTCVAMPCSHMRASRSPFSFLSRCTCRAAGACV